jgi:hypothetical protein
MVTHLFARLGTAFASLFVLPESASEPHTSDIDPSEYWRYDARFYYMWPW